MRIRPLTTAVPVAVLLAALTGCGGSDDKPEAKMTPVAIRCDQFADTAKKITDAQTELYDGSGGTKAIDALLEELDALKKGAPADVKDALSEMSDAFEKAQQIMKQPTQQAAAQLAELGPKLSADSQKITAYIVAKCH